MKIISKDAEKEQSRKVSFSVPAVLADRYEAALKAAEEKKLIVDPEFSRWLKIICSKIERAVSGEAPKARGKGK